MSGGHYEYLYQQLNNLADYIESDFINDGKHMVEDWSADISFYNRPLIEADRLEDATPEQKKIILTEVRDLIKTLQITAQRAKELEWYLSGDTGAESYLERLKKIK